MYTYIVKIYIIMYICIIVYNSITYIYIYTCIKYTYIYNTYIYIENICIYICIHNQAGSHWARTVIPT